MEGRARIDAASSLPAKRAAEAALCRNFGASSEDVVAQSLVEQAHAATVAAPESRHLQPAVVAAAQGHCQAEPVTQIHRGRARGPLELSPREERGCVLQVTCRCEHPYEWMHFYPGWVSWLLVLKAAADFCVDLRNGSPERTWSQRYVDP